MLWRLMILSQIYVQELAEKLGIYKLFGSNIIWDIDLFLRCKEMNNFIQILINILTLNYSVIRKI